MNSSSFASNLSMAVGSTASAFRFYVKMIQVLAEVKITLKFVGASVVVFNNKTPDYSLNTTI
jgi:hypothetical protein